MWYITCCVLIHVIMYMHYFKRHGKWLEYTLAGMVSVKC